MKNLKIKFSIVVALALIFNTNIIYAQHDHGSHNHGQGHQMKMAITPHGGEIREAGKYRIEMVTDILLKEDQLSFYLFKGNMKPISNEGVSGNITFNFNNDSALNENLQAKGDDRFVAQLKNSDSFNCEVKFIIDGKEVSGVFHHEGSNDGVVGLYSCPMHSDVKSSNPGSCPKCGMKLEKQ